MSAYLVVDASCDLPESYIRENKIGILPVHVSIAGRELIDNKDENALRQFYKDDLLSLDIKASTQPWTSSQISDYVLKDVVSEHSSLLIETVARSRSAIFENAHSASYTVTRDYKNYKEGESHFSMRVMDSGSMFAGMGVLAMHTNKLIQNGYTASQLRKELEGFKEKLWVYAIPKDVKHLRARVKQRGDNSVSWMAANFINILDIAPIICGHDGDTYPVGKIRGHENAVNTLFDQTADKVKKGLLTPYVMVSIAGLVEELETFSAYSQLQNVCLEHGVELHRSMMSMTGAINMGKGTITVGFASQEEELTF